MKRFALALILTTLAAPAAAESYVPIKDEDTFVSLVQGKELRNRLYGVRLNVLDNGQIDGAALGWGIEGSWTWQNGYFCREMSWGGTRSRTTANLSKHVATTGCGSPLIKVPAILHRSGCNNQPTSSAPYRRITGTISSSSSIR